MNRIQLLPILLVLSLGSCMNLNNNTGNAFLISEKKGRYVLRDEATNRVIRSFNEANLAFNYALSMIDSLGGRINLLAGKYLLNTPVNLKSKTKFQGTGPSTILIIPDKNKRGVALVIDNQNGVIVSDLMIQSQKKSEDTETGILISHSGGCTIKDVNCISTGKHGIILRKNSFLCEIRGCRVMGTSGSGILLDSLDRGGRGGDWVPNLVSNCIINSCGKGIECHRTIVANIIGCEVYQAEGPAYYIHNTSNSILLSGCRSYQIQDDAVFVDNSHEINITGNIFCWHEKRGIVLDHVRWGTITGNNIIDNGSLNIWPEGFEGTDNSGLRPFAFEKPDTLIPNNIPGIVLVNSTRGVIVNGNAIFNWPVVPPMDYGVIEDATCSYNIISSNNVNYYLYDAVFSKGSNSQVNNNLGFPDRPHQGDTGNMIQSFDLSLMKKFIGDFSK